MLLKNASLISRITAGKGLSPYNASVLLKVIINEILGFGTEVILITSNYFGDELMKSLEYM